MREPAEGKLQMQPVQTSHHLQIARRYRTRQIIDTATADIQSRCLLGDGQIVLTVDHRFALSNPALVSAPSRKSFPSVNPSSRACTELTSIAASAVQTARVV